MNLYIVAYVPGERGCPLLLKGDLNMDHHWDVFDPDIDKFDVPEGYVYKSKDKVLSFDYWDINWMASSRFVEICRKFGLRVRTVPVDIIQSTGKPTEKSYFFLLWSEWTSVIDLENSEFEFDRNSATGEIEYYRYFSEVPMLLSVGDFIVDQAKIPKAAAFKCLDLGHSLVCNEEFKAACEQAGLSGIGFEDITSYKKSGFWG